MSNILKKGTNQARKATQKKRGANNVNELCFESFLQDTINIELQ